METVCPHVHINRTCTAHLATKQQKTNQQSSRRTNKPLLSSHPPHLLWSMDPPDFFHDIRRDRAARDASKQHQDPGPSTKRAREMPPTKGDLLTIGQEIQNLSLIHI